MTIQKENIPKYYPIFEQSKRVYNAYKNLANSSLFKLIIKFGIRKGVEIYKENRKYNEFSLESIDSIPTIGICDWCGKSSYPNGGHVYLCTEQNDRKLDVYLCETCFSESLQSLKDILILKIKKG